MSSDGYVELVWGATAVLWLVVWLWSKFDSMAHRRYGNKFRVNEVGQSVPVSRSGVDWTRVFTVIIIVIMIGLVGVVSGLFGAVITGMMNSY